RHYAAIILADSAEIIGQRTLDQHLSAVIAERLSERGSLTQESKGSPPVFQLCPRIAQVQPEIDGLCTRGATVREPLQDLQGLLIASYRLLIRRTRFCLSTCLPQVGKRFVPDFASEGMIGEVFDLFAQPVSVEGFPHLDKT